MGTRYVHQAMLRPIMSSNGSPMQHIPEFIDYIISSPLSNTILLEGHYRPSSRDLTNRTPSTRKHPGHTQCLLPLHNIPSLHEGEEACRGALDTTITIHSSVSANLFMAELCRRTCSTGHSKTEHMVEIH